VLFAIGLKASGDTPVKKLPNKLYLGGHVGRVALVGIKKKSQQLDV
jgi:hypothetical protein